jgi:hypothetical protein
MVRLFISDVDVVDEGLTISERSSVQHVDTEKKTGLKLLLIGVKIFSVVVG